MAWNYNDVKLTCPFCKSKMDLDDILVDSLRIPQRVLYICSNTRCNFKMEIDFDEFDERVKKFIDKKESNEKEI